MTITYESFIVGCTIALGIPAVAAIIIALYNLFKIAWKSMTDEH